MPAPNGEVILILPVELPHEAEFVGVPVTVEPEFTVTLTVAVAVHPSAFVTVTL